MRISFPMLHLPIAGVVLLVNVVIHAQDAKQPPNVILIFADDLGYGDVSCFSEESPFSTPHLDKMAKQGAKLTSFYVPTPYCAPSRGTILTGRYPFRHSVVRNPAPDAGINNFGLPPEEITIAELLKEKGYATAAYGKWHLGHQEPWLPRKQGFDEYLGILYSNDMFPVQLVHNEEVVEYPVVQATLTKRYTDKAISFIEEHQEQPFFLYLPHAMPHKPLAASENYYTPETKNDLYADVIAELDADVGRLLSTLKRLGIDEQTLVIFTSDNGPWYGGSTGGLRGMKAKTWEGGLRVPFLARMPGTIRPGIQNDAPTASIDVFPTVAELAGIELPQDRKIDGKSLWALLNDSSAPSPHEAIFGMQGLNLATIRMGKWKLHVRSPGLPRFSNLTEEQLQNYIDPRGPDGVNLLAPYEQAPPTAHPGVTSGDDPQAMMLFDLENDPSEQHNLADDHPHIKQKLLTAFRKMEQELPEFPRLKNDYLFRRTPGQSSPLMRLIGGELRYDQIPETQKKWLKSSNE